MLAGFSDMLNVLKITSNTNWDLATYKPQSARHRPPSGEPDSRHYRTKQNEGRGVSRAGDDFVGRGADFIRTQRGENGQTLDYN